MKTVLSSFIKEYPSELSPASNMVREICQEIVLCGLSRSNFFDSMAFHGGTSLRIFHGLERFSEDLDFCQLTDVPPDPEIVSDFIEKEFKSLGLDYHVTSRMRSTGNINVFYVKGNKRDTMRLFGIPDDMLNLINPDAVISIKMDMDAETPEGFGFTHEYKTSPFNYRVTILDKPSLFAAKTSAIISRHWKNRTKGRDLFDFEWYISNNTPLNTVYLINNLLREGKVPSPDVSKDDLLAIMRDRFNSIDYDSAMLDLYPFVDLDKIPDNWSPDHFIDLSKKIVFV